MIRTVRHLIYLFLLSLYVCTSAAQSATTATSTTAAVASTTSSSASGAQTTSAFASTFATSTSAAAGASTTGNPVTTGPTITAPSLPLCGTNPFCFRSRRGELTILWTISKDAIHFTLTGLTLGWIATGINTDASMFGADIWWCRYKNGRGVVIDRYSLEQYGRIQPPADPVQNLFNISVVQDTSANLTRCQFSRALVCADPQHDLNISSIPLYILWAANSDPGSDPATPTSDYIYSEHDIGYGTSQRVNLLNPGNAPVVAASLNESRRRAHGVLMLIAWAFFAPIGLFLARFGKSILGHRWLYLHAGSQLVNLLVTFVGFILIIVDQSKRRSKHFSSQGGHRIIGLVTVIVGFLQIIVGVLADRLFKPDRSRAPIFPDMVHWVLGYAIVLLAYANVWLGAAMYCVNTATVVLFGLAFLVALFGFFAFDLLTYLTEFGPALTSHQKASEIPVVVVKFVPLVLLVVLGALVAGASYSLNQTSETTIAFYGGCLTPQLGAAGDDWKNAFIAGIVICAVVAVADLIVYFVMARKTEVRLLDQAVD